MTCNSAYTLCTLNEEYWKRALERVEKNPIYDGSHRQGMANQVGFLGEIVAEKWFSKHCIPFQHEDVTKHDYIICNKITLDVKTKDRTVAPKINYDNSVPLYNHNHQRPDYYLFISLLRDKSFDQTDIRRFTHAYIVGAIDIATLDDKAKKWEAGDIDPDNGTKFWTACLNVNMADLTPLSEVKKIWLSSC